MFFTKNFYIFIIILFSIYSCKSKLTKIDESLTKPNDLILNKLKKPVSSKKINKQETSKTQTQLKPLANKKKSPKLFIPALDWKDELKAIEEKKDFDAFLKTIYSNGEEDLNKQVEDKSFFINYEKMKLSKFISLIAKVLGFDYILHEQVKGTVTINLQNDVKLTNKELWLVFDYILSINGAYISISDNKVVKILPTKQFGKLLNKTFNKNSNISLHSFKLKNSKSSDVIKLLNSLFKEGVSIVESPNKRDVVVIGSNELINKIAVLIKKFDEQKDKGWSRQILHCKNLPASLLAKELAAIMKVLGFPVVTQHKDNNGKQISVIPFDRHKAILISSPNQETIDYINKWLKQIDYIKEKAKEEIFTYPVKYSNAAVLIESVNAFFNETETTLSTATGTTAGTANGAVTGPVNESADINGPLTLAAQDSIFSDKITLYEDRRVNRIILKCLPRTFTFVKTLLDILDAPPLQALVRVTAVDIQLNDDLQYGFSYAAKKQFGSGNNDLSTAVGSSIAAGALQVNTEGSAPPTGLGLLFEKAGVNDEFGFIRAVATNTETRLLNTPEILVQNLKTASIQIGSDVPYSSGVQQNNNNTLVQNIQYRETGVLLEVTPDIGLDGYISLKVKQEISSIADTTVAGIQSPTFNKSLIETYLTLKDGETFLIGGIITTRKNLSEDGIPILHRMPLIGNFFKSKNTGARKSELVILVTVKSIREQNELHDVLTRYNSSVRELTEEENKHVYDK